MTILLAVGLIPLVCTTVKADATSDLLNKYSVKWYVIDNKGYYHVYLMTTAMTNKYIDQSRNGQYNYYSYAMDFNNGLTYDIDTIDGLFWVTQGTANNQPYPISLDYNGVQWEINIPLFSYVNANTFQWNFIDNRFVTSATQSAPSGFPAVKIESGVTLEQVQTQINNALNSTTSATTSANNIQTNVTNNYISYVNGNITLNQLQANLDNLKQQLEDLNSMSGTTLADKMAINNAITQTQLVQDAANKDAIIAEMEEDLTVSSPISATITGKINQANQIFNQYDTGDITQTEAVTQINQYITQLTQLITPKTPTADINAINAAINTINGIKDSVTSHSDLDNSVSESAQNSDKEELEYLDNLEAETTDNIDSLKSKVDNSISESQANQVKNNVIAPILQNTLIVKVLPIAALFMVLAVTLGFKYRL